MKHALLIASLAAFLGPGGVATAQDYQNPSATTAAEIPTVPAGTVMTAPFSEALARDVYVWGWPIVNAFHRRASFAAAPEPGLQDGVLPVAPTGYVGMLHSYISPDQRWVAHPKGTIPGGIAGVIHSPTDLIAMGPRIFLDETDEDRAAIQQVLDQVVVYPLSKFDGKLKTKVWADVPHFKPAASSSSTGGKAAETSWVNPNTFFDELPGISRPGAAASRRGSAVCNGPRASSRRSVRSYDQGRNHTRCSRNREDYHLSALRFSHQRPAPAGRLEFATKCCSLGLRLFDARRDSEVQHVCQSTNRDPLLFPRSRSRRQPA